MEQIILCKYGEIALKGANRGFFETQLVRELTRVSKPYGVFHITHAQSTAMLRPLSPDCEVQGAFAAVRRVFGITAVSVAYSVAKDPQAISDALRELAPTLLQGYRTFKVEAKRSDKAFPMTSPQLCAMCGEVILSVCPQICVNVHAPQITVRVEIRDEEAFIHAGEQRGAGGIPIGSSGQGLLLLSGGIDSPVAGYMMAKRGVRLDAVHFESFPYTSERAREKVLELAEKLSAYCGTLRIHIISLTHIQEQLRACCEEDYFTLLLRRFMMRLALRTAHKNGAKCLITGESLGQVASQTMEAIGVTEVLADMPVFRPLIGMDKEEIITLARKIDTFELSILPYEDCCTVFTPRHPRTKPELLKVEREEAKVDVQALCDEAFATLYTVTVKTENP
ncbi:MAG: tRNA uracil 4-sulfurtransferase ThiI [Eubacteriales bacterium]|nr:tRNA uracil 4-sulfurtransferase ThiI [Eubacteriales bacterium]